MTAVPLSLREGAYGLGASKLQVATRVVVPGRAVRDRRRRSCSGVSRAVGETMIVLIAAGAGASNSLDPPRRIQTMTAFIAPIGHGDVADRQHRVQDDLRGRHAAVRRSRS